MTKSAPPPFQTGNVLLIAFSHLLHDVYGAFLPPLLPLLIKKLGFSYTLAGLLPAAQRLPSLLNPFIGVIADRVSVRYFVILAPAVTALAMSLLGIAPSYLMLFVLLLIAGIASACYHVPSPVVMRYVAGARVGKGMSFYMLGGELARTLGPLVIVGAVSLWGLEGTYKLFPFGLLASFFLFFKLRHVRIQEHVSHQTGRTGLKETSKTLLPLFLKLSGIVFFMGAMKAAMMSFLPSYLTSQGYSLAAAGISLSIMQVGSVVGTLAAGSLSDTFGRKTILLVSAITSPILMWLFLSSSGMLTLPLLCVLGFFLFSTGPVMLAVVQDSNSDRPAYVNGIYMMLNFVIGSVMAVSVGAMGDRFGFEITYNLSAFLFLGAMPCILMLPGKIKLSHRESSP